jgi:chlorophyll(ide) b reductase
MFAELDWPVLLWGIVGAIVVVAAVWKVVSDLGAFHPVDVSTSRHLRVFITGGSRGIGLALARKFVSLGDSVVIAGRKKAHLDEALEGLRALAGEGVVVDAVVGDVSDYESISAAGRVAQERLGGRVDLWLQNAGVTQPSLSPLKDTPADTVEGIVRTNCLGPLFAVKAATTLLSAQDSGGHVFIMDGAGATGMATPNFATYGYSKAGIPQLLKSAQGESHGTGVVVHGMSPGMVLTDLLLRSVSVGCGRS